MLVKAVLTGIWLFVIPIIIGNGMVCFTKQSERKAGHAFIYGYVTMFSLFQILAIPSIYLHLRFQMLVNLYTSAVIVLMAGSLIVYRKQWLGVLKYKYHMPKNINYIWILVLLLILAQTAVSALGMHVDEDDSFFVATAATSWTDNSMFEIDAYTGAAYEQFPSRYVLSPFPIWIAFLSRVTGFHPAVMAHTILPVLMIPLAYLVYYLIGKQLFRGDSKKTGLFMLLISVITISSYYSVYTSGTFLLIRSWQGKSVLAAILLPFIFYLCLRLLHEKAETREWMALLLTMISSLLVSSMGIMLPVIMVGIFIIIYGLLGRDWKKLTYGIGVCIPNLLFAAVYLFIR